MKKKLTAILIFVLGLFLITNYFENNSISKESNQIRNLHSQNLKQSPFNSTLELSKTERKAKGLTPNKFYEQEWNLTMNPVTGRPTTEKLQFLRDSIIKLKKSLMLLKLVNTDIFNIKHEKLI